MMRHLDIITKLQSLSDPKTAKSMAWYGIKADYGIPISTLRKIAGEIGPDHLLAQELWASSIREARILATMIEEPEAVTEEQMEQWAVECGSWDVCEQCCLNLFSKTSLASRKASEWSGSGDEYVRRAGLILSRLLVSVR